MELSRVADTDGEAGVLLSGRGAQGCAQIAILHSVRLFIIMIMALMMKATIRHFMGQLSRLNFGEKVALSRHNT